MMPETQSAKFMCTGTESKGASGGGLARDERMRASMKTHQPTANLRSIGFSMLL